MGQRRMIVEVAAVGAEMDAGQDDFLESRGDEALRFGDDPNNREKITYINKMTIRRFRRMLRQMGITRIERFSYIKRES